MGVVCCLRAHSKPPGAAPGGSIAGNQLQQRTAQRSNFFRICSSRSPSCGCTGSVCAAGAGNRWPQSFSCRAGGEQGRPNAPHRLVGNIMRAQRSAAQWNKARLQLRQQRRELLQLRPLGALQLGDALLQGVGVALEGGGKYGAGAKQGYGLNPLRSAAGAGAITRGCLTCTCPAPTLIATQMGHVKRRAPRIWLWLSPTQRAWNQSPQPSQHIMAAATAAQWEGVSRPAQVSAAGRWQQQRLSPTAPNRPACMPGQPGGALCMVVGALWKVCWQRQ